jgi:hypothetical protein
MTFSGYYDHTNPLFMQLNIIKHNNLVYLHNAIFVYNLYSGKLPQAFDKYFISVKINSIIIIPDMLQGQSYLYFQK